MLHTQPLSYAQRAKNVQNKSKDDSAVLDNPTSPTLAVKALSIVAAQKDTTIVNVWSQRKEKMAAATAATHQQQQQNTFPSRDNTTDGPPIVDTNSWPEVGKGFETASGTTDEQEREKENVSHTPRKSKWVPIPPEELQEAADALRVKSKSSRSNSRNNNKRNATAAHANPNANGSTQNQSGRQSTPASTSHSRVNSRSASVHSSPHLFARGRRLPDDLDHSVPPVPTLNGTNANGGMKPLTKDDAYRPYQPQPYLPSPITITRNNTNTSTGSPTYPYPIYPAYGSGPGPAFEYPAAGSSTALQTMPTPHQHHHSTMPTPQTMPAPQPYWLHHNPSSHTGSGQNSPVYPPPPQGMYSMPQPVHLHGSGRKPPEHAAPGFSYGYDLSNCITTGNGNGKKARRGGPVLFGSIASAQEVTPSPSPGPSMPVPVPVNGVSGGGGVGGLAIDELGVRRITTRHGSEQGGVLNGAGMGKWEFGTTGLTLDDQPPQADAGVDDANLKLEDSPTLNIPLKTNTNGFAASESSKPSSGSVSPLVGLGGGLDAFSVKDFGFGFGSRRANVSVGGVNEEDEGGEGEQEKLVKEQEKLVKAKTAELDLGSHPRGGEVGTQRPVDVSRTEVDDPSFVAQDDIAHSGGGRPRRGSYTGGGGYAHSGRRGGGRGGTYRGGAGAYPRGGVYNSSSRGSRPSAVYSHHHQHHQHHPQAPFSLSQPPHFQPIEPLSVLAPNTAYFPPPRYFPGFEAPAYQGFPPPAHGQVQPQQGVPPPMPVPLSTLSFPLDPTRYYLLGQLEYYLSPQNMAQDFFLRQRMDSKGWIPIQLLASFNRVRQLTLDIMLVRDVLLLSSVAQVHHGGDWVRMGGWESFVLPDAKKSGVDDPEAVAVERGQDEGVDQVGGFMEEYVAGESAVTTLAFAQGESEPGERAFAKGEPGRQEGSSRRSAGEGGGVRDSPTDVIEGEALEVSEGNGKGGDLGYEEVEEEVEEEEEEEEEEEDVVFVMGEEVQAVAGTWSPERIAS